MSWERIYSFFHLLDAFRQIRRVTYADHEKQLENDAEHSYQLAMMAWYICVTKGLDHDIDKIIRYALVHDFVEVYAGDTMALGRSKSDEAKKAKQEQQAIEKLRETLPEFPDLADWIETYESKADPESRFVYALDKYLATINSYDKGGAIWKDHDVTLQQVEKSLRKSESDPDICELAERLLAKISDEEEDLFDTQN